MSAKNSLSESIKEAVTATSRAISGNPEIEISFGGMGSSLPNPPRSLEELRSFRGKADSLACVEKYRDKSLKVQSGIERVDSLVRVMEDARVEILGSIDYPGVASNIQAKFSDKCKLYRDLEEQADNIEMGIEAWLRKICLPDIPSPESLSLIHISEPTRR